MAIDYPIMDIEEMRKHEWVVSWSGGKDSTATVLLMRQFGVPIKKIIYVRMMWDDELPATLPEMTSFVDRTAKLFSKWGYKVEIVKSLKKAYDITQTVFKKSKYVERNGHIYGMTAFTRGSCSFTKVKQQTIWENTNKLDYGMIGIAHDEKKRYHNLTARNQSIMITLGISEAQALKICEEHNLLSPLYKMKMQRDGCWFCPNAAKREREHLYRRHPELIMKIFTAINEIDFELTQGLIDRNNWIKDYMKLQSKESNNGKTEN